jgi:signal-transduction protein with cAMP-binding, CBS, and nucleotidyltransferase domain
MPITLIGELMTEKLQTIGRFSSAQETSMKMRNHNISSLLVVDSNCNNKTIGIITERDLLRKVCAIGTSSNNIITENIMSSFPLVTIDIRSPIAVAANAMIQNKVRHLLVVENNDINKPLGIITPTDFVGYLKENLNLEDDEVNAKILDALKGKAVEKEEDAAVRELEQQGKLQKDSPKGGQEYENEEPRQG